MRRFLTLGAIHCTSSFSRHGKAEDVYAGITDADRKLTQDGIAEMYKPKHWPLPPWIRASI